MERVARPQRRSGGLSHAQNRLLRKLAITWPKRGVVTAGQEDERSRLLRALRREGDPQVPVMAKRAAPASTAETLPKQFPPFPTPTLKSLLYQMTSPRPDVREDVPVNRLVGAGECAALGEEARRGEAAQGPAAACGGEINRRDEDTKHTIRTLVDSLQQRREEMKRMQSENDKGLRQAHYVVAATTRRLSPKTTERTPPSLPLCAPVAPLPPVETPSLIPSLMSLKLSPPRGWKPAETPSRKAKPLPSERPAVASNEPKRIFCWNCGDTNHAWVRCPKPLQVFCRRCGRWGVSKPDCPECREEWLRERESETKNYKPL